MPQDIDMPAKSLAENFLRDVHNFVSETGISDTALGTAAVSDGSIIAQIKKNGRSPTLRTADRIYSYMAHERTRRAEPGARRSTACQEGACLSEAEAQDCEAALAGAPGWWARALAWLRL